MSAELAHQPVVAATAADAGLGAQPVVHELEGGLGVVIEPANHSRVDDIRHAQPVEVSQHGLEVLLGLTGQMVEHHRGISRHRLDLGTLVVKHPQRVDLGALTRFLIKIEVKQEVLQQFPVLRSAGVITQRGDFQAEPIETERTETRVGNGDHLGIQRRVVHADGFHTDLL